MRRRLRRRRPDDRDELDEPADPEACGAQVHPVGELGEPGVPGVGRRVAREREPRREAEAGDEHGPEQDTPVGEPREEEQRRDEREAELHRDERRPEAGAARDRREVAVEEPPERQLQRILARSRNATMPVSSTTTAPIPVTQ